MKKKLKTAAQQAARKAKPFAQRAARKAKPYVKEVVFSDTVRKPLRTVHGAQPALVKRVEKELPFNGVIQSLTSESLPQGKYYARITIRNWAAHKLEHFRLYENGKLVYGNTIEQPQRGFPLEYRNILVSSDDPAAFTTDLDLDFVMTFKRGAFTTAHQENFDTKYGVIQEGNLFFSQRGNLKNPKKVIFTFPGFGPSATRTSYAVTYFKQLDSHDLQDTAIICFQDRYGAAGTYMKNAHSGKDLRRDVDAFIRRRIEKYGVSPKDVLFFGASKGATIAIEASEAYPESPLIIVVPQLDLPNFTCKPFFKDNLYTLSSFHSETQPGDLLRRYVEEGRNIWHFFSNNDEQSNASIPEFWNDTDSYRRFRVDGTHGQVAARCLNTVLGIIRNHISPREVEVEGTGTMRFFGDDPSHLPVQIDVRSEKKLAVDEEAYLRVESEGGVLYQAVTAHSITGVFYSKEDQALVPTLDKLSGQYSFVVFNANGRTREWTLQPGKIPFELQEVPESPNFSIAPGLHEHILVDKYLVERYVYAVGAGSEIRRIVLCNKVPDKVADYSVYVVISDPDSECKLLPVLVRRVCARLRVEDGEVIVETPLNRFRFEALAKKELWF